MTVRELVENGVIRELYKATRGPFGGHNVNRQFRILLEQIFTKSFLDNYACHNPVDWLCLMNDFEVKKRGKRICEGGTTRIRLPGSFLSKFLSQRGCDINTAIQQHYNLDEIKVLRNEYLCLEPKVMRQLFNPVLDDIISHLSNLLAKPELSEVKFAFLVGGFSDSAVLQERIKGHFGQAYRILIPHCASLAIVQGAEAFHITNFRSTFNKASKPLTIRPILLFSSFCRNAHYPLYSFCTSLTTHGKNTASLTSL